MNALTKPFNALGWPALSLPAGADRDGLPLGLQVVGLPGNDALVLRAAAALEGTDSGLSDAQDRLEAALDVVVRRRPRAHADAHRGPALPDACRRTSTCPSACTAAITRRVVVRLAERDEHLVEHDVVEDLVARGASPSAKRAACRQLRSISSSRPERPSERSAAQTSTPRARRESSGV